MKIIYYVIEKRINSFDEATGTKDVRAYELKDGKMSLICEIKINNTENSEASLLSQLEKQNLIQTKPNLIEL